MLSCQQIQKKNKQQANTPRIGKKIANTNTKLSILSGINHDSFVLLSSSRQKEGCGDAPPQTIDYEEIVPLGLSTNHTADATPMSHAQLSLQLVNNMAYGHVCKTNQCTEIDPTGKNQTVPSEAYAQKSKPRGP